MEVQRPPPLILDWNTIDETYSHCLCIECKMNFIKNSAIVIQNTEFILAMNNLDEDAIFSISRSTNSVMYAICCVYGIGCEIDHERADRIFSLNKNNDIGNDNYINFNDSNFSSLIWY